MKIRAALLAASGLVLASAASAQTAAFAVGEHEVEHEMLSVPLPGWYGATHSSVVASLEVTRVPGPVR